MRLTTAQVKRLKSLDTGVVYLFGSYAEGRSLPLSDLDIAVFFKDVSRLKDKAEKIYDELYDIFTDVFPGKNIDIVFLQKANLELCFDVIRHGAVLYEESGEMRLDFEERITRLYADFKPLLKNIDRTILNRS